MAPSLTSTYTNRGMIECLRDNVPIGVMRQVSARPHARYLMLGLAHYEGKAEGHFLIEGFAQMEGCTTMDPRKCGI